jgi:hypothetical protein
MHEMKKSNFLPFPIARIIRSRRKTIALQITEEGELWVRVPYRAGEADIRRVIAKHAAWIEKHMQAAQQRKALYPRHRFVEGELFYYLGQAYPLQFDARPSPALSFSGSAFVLYFKAQPQAKALFEAWYREQAAAFFPERVAFWAERAGLSGRYAAVKVSHARKRWGSCSTKGSLNFSWRLMMAPPEMIDYVIVHELAHLKHHNHSAAFWQEVAKQMPAYRLYHNQLKEEGYKFTL